MVQAEGSILSRLFLDSIELYLYDSMTIRQQSNKHISFTYIIALPQISNFMKHNRNSTIGMGYSINSVIQIVWLTYIPLKSGSMMFSKIIIYSKQNILVFYKTINYEYGKD